MNDNIQPNKSFFRRFWWLILIIVLIVIVGIIFGSQNEKIKSIVTGVPVCPSNLSGVFTHSIVDQEKIAAVEPRGFVNGGDHVMPVIHQAIVVYFDQGSHPIYAPADMTITTISNHRVVSGSDGSKSQEFYFDADICQGLSIWISAINKLSPTLEEIWNKSNKKQSNADANADVKIFNDLMQSRIKVKAGEIIGYAGEGKPGVSIEIATINKNLPSRKDIDWNYYHNADRKVGSMCLVDLYAGGLKEFLYAKLGSYIGVFDDSIKISSNAEKEEILFKNPIFTPRTKEPRCGEAVQNLVGTIQGDWFYGKPGRGQDLEAEGRTLTFIHDNLNPSVGVISIGGTVVDVPRAVRYQPTQNGKINREPSEVKADGKVYCYAWEGRIGDAKILVQLIDDHHLKIESRTGKCNPNETFNKPFVYER